MLEYVLTIFVVTLSRAENIQNPIYQYRYQTQDIMKTDASRFPLHGYHVVEEGYYPKRSFDKVSGDFSGRSFVGDGLFFDGPSKFGRQLYPFVGNKFGDGEFIGSEISPSVHRHHGVGSEYADKHIYSGGNKKLNGNSFEKAVGRKEEDVSRGHEGYNQGKITLKNSKGDSGYYSEEGGGQKSSGKEQSYKGGQHYNQEGENEGEKKQNGFHKKGHVVKGFKSSHHKDEDGKTEDFYDEEHDEGNNYNYGGQSSGYGENTQSSYKGGHDNGQFNADQNRKEGHFKSHHTVDNTNTGHDQYNQKEYTGNEEVRGVHNGVDQHSLLGHQEANRIFKHHPYHVPFFPAY